jgi:hypothetical protein
MQIFLSVVGGMLQKGEFYSQILRKTMGEHPNRSKYSRHQGSRERERRRRRMAAGIQRAA